MSGGVESTALAYLLRPDVCITVDYGQPAALGEVKQSRLICAQLGLVHKVISAPVYKESSRSPQQSWWPLRNQILITCASISLQDYRNAEIIVGFVKDDIYKDCTIEFVNSINLCLGTQETGHKVVAPAIYKSTFELLEDSQFPRELLGLLFSCHFSSLPCGACPGCLKNLDVTERWHRHLDTSQCTQYDGR